MNKYLGDILVGQILVVGGALDGQQTEVTGYDGATKLTFTALTEAPIAGQKFRLV